MSSSWFFLVNASSSYGAGYGINENSASYLATGFAGRASNPVDASIAANNPAGISFIEGSMISVGSALILEGGEFEGAYTGLQHSNPLLDGRGKASGKTKNFQKTTPVPFGHFVMPIDERFSFGLSGYGPFGIELDYKNDWPGQYFGDKTSVKVINLQGTLAFKQSDDFSIGLGLIGSYVKGLLTQSSGLPGLLPLTGTVEGDDTTFGWNIGALWQVNDSTNIGVVYHSKLDFTVKGDTKVEGDFTPVVPGTDFPRVALNAKVDAELKITMPERAAISITHQLDDRWTVMADATWTRWSRFEEFHVKAKEDIKVLGQSLNPSTYIPMNWKDVWAFSIGTSYQLNDQWLLRAGYMLDKSPVDDKNRTVRSPDADRNWFTFGANWQPSAELSIDLSYAFVDLKKGSISESKHKEDGSPVPIYGTLTGEYANSSHIVAAQLNYLF
ncbi:MAG: OmpP1/FadL family transporter [Endozoicomonas sp.]